MNVNESRYLGDGLYAEFDGYQIEIYASNGVNKTARVFLDNLVTNNFVEYVHELHDALEDMRDEEA